MFDWDVPVEGQRFMFPVAACTCGTWDRLHEARCGFEDDEEEG